MDTSQEIQATLQRIYDRATQAMSGIMDTRNMYIALYDAETGDIEFQLAYVNGERAPDEERARGKTWGPRHFGDRKGLTEWVIRHKQPLLIEKDFENWVNSQDDLEAFSINTKCWLGAPMLLRDKVIGVIGLQNFEQEGVFDEHHRELLLTIAGQVATAIENARLFQITRRAAEERQRRLTLLQQISQRMAEAGRESDGVLELVARAAYDISGSELTAIYLYDQEAGNFTSGVGINPAGEAIQLEGDSLPDSEGLTAHIAASQEPIFVENVEDRPDVSDFARRRQLQAFAGLPLTTGGMQPGRTTVGVLFVNFSQPHPFPADDQEILRHLANQAAVAIAYATAQTSAQAREQLAALGGATATLQHRLGNTINVILPAVMRLRRRGGDDDPIYHEILDTIERNVGIATQVIRRMQEPLHQQTFIRVNINSLLREAILKCVAESYHFSSVQIAVMFPDSAPETSASGGGASSQITIVTEFDEQIPQSYASSGQLSEVFHVLVENGIKAIYPEAGSVIVRSRLENDRSRQFAVITISDTGTGIDEVTRSRLFKEPVPREDFSRGAGLGLWLSNIIVRGHQGHIGLQTTEPGQGSTFMVRLPIVNQMPLGYASGQEGEDL
ncbi:MAG TPA: GAF domain-containing protein [Anaerolineae bacterium]|jgi:GAF domain-containing protein